MTIDDEERAALYQLPLGEFTASRNALAKSRGVAGADIRQLEKPHAAAWAVNQLFWHRRPAYDLVTTAAQAMRDAHARLLSGRPNEVAQAEAAHHDAVRGAVAVIQELAGAVDEKLSPSTLEAVSETLRALPSDVPAGQLTKPLKPLGFSALMSLGLGRGPGLQGSRGPGVRQRGAAERAKAEKEAAERAARRKALLKTLRAAQAKESAAESALETSRKALSKVEREHGAARDRVQFLEKRRDDAERQTQQRARALHDASNARAQAEQELNTAD